MNSVLEFHDIYRAYKKGEQVLKGVTFAVAPGEVVGLVGRNGAGKTTLMHIAMGLLAPQAGSVRVFGLSPTEDPVAVKRRIGFVSEDQALPPNSNLTELIAFHRYLFWNWDEALERQLIDRFGIPAKKKIGTLSKGQARQAALLCAVCHRPELLILDEPAGGLDPAARREFLETSIQLLNREGTAILFSSHHMTDLERIGGRVVLLDQGVVRLDRELDALRENVSIAMIPRATTPDSAAIERVPGCLRVRHVFDDWHAVVEGPPEEATERLRAALGVNGIRCVHAPLEELFIELVGGER
jgi:ABC-2 type transport system ATP-binding protein